MLKPFIWVANPSPALTSKVREPEGFVDEVVQEEQPPKKKNIYIYIWASLVAQWLRICLPMQGTRVQALVWEDPTCRGATRPVSHNY